MDGDEPIEEPVTWRRAPVLFADRLGLRPAGLLGALAGILAVGFGAWWALRPPPPPAEEQLPFVQEVAAPAPTTTAGSVDVVVVHVDGAVRFPGVHELRPGSRVTDAIDAAGGLTDGADRRQINLAQPVADGQRIWVPVEGEDVVVIVGTGGDDAGAEPGGVVALSTASAEALETLPGIGPSLANAIVEHRSREGPFGTVDDLLAVPGIGPAKLDALRGLVAP
ncbi:MAG: ComEA family DNA-binding protein [Actinomycetota bacterium]